MLELLRLLNALLAMLGSWRQPIANLLLQPLLTVALLLCLYAGWHVRDQGDLLNGLRVAFVDTTANRQAEEQRIVTGVLQAELRQYARAGKLIDQQLVSLLAHSDGAARIRLGVIHDGVSGLTGTSLLRYDIINSAVLPGRAAGDAVVNEPLTTWSEFLPSLLAGKCEMFGVADVRNYALQARLHALGTNNELACPVIDVEGRLLGALLSNWDAADRPPIGPRLQAVIDANLRVGGQIAAVISLRDIPGANARVVADAECERRQGVIPCNHPNGVRPAAPVASLP